MAEALLDLPANTRIKRGPNTEPQGSTEPERKLLEAILQDAIECWQACAVIAPQWRVSGYSQLGKRQRNYNEADFWLFDQYDNEPWFSFTKICDHLGLDPDFIRRRLLEWRRAQSPVPASLTGSCPRSFDSARDARFAQDDRTKRLSPFCHPERSEGSTRRDLSGTKWSD